MPNRRSIVVWSTAVFVFCAMAAPLRAATPAPTPTWASAPITILSCYAENFGGYGGQVADVVVSFKNSYTMPATSVRFVFTYKGVLGSVVDKGTYAPNVKVTNRYHVFVDQFFKGKTMDACGVGRAAFADGKVWTY